MAKISKQRRHVQSALPDKSGYSVAEALGLLKQISFVKFDESVDVAVNLGVDTRKSDQQVRGSTVLPNGTGKSVKIAVFATGEDVEKAKLAGADRVGSEDLITAMQGGDISYDIIIATPDMMPSVTKLGPVLGPRGLMPNPKLGTVTTDVEQAVEDAKRGKISYRADKNGIVHCTIGRVSFKVEHLMENLDVLLSDLRKLKPSAAKGLYFRKMSLSTTMGPGLQIDQSNEKA